MDAALLDTVERWLRAGRFHEARDALPDPDTLQGELRLRALLLQANVVAYFRTGSGDGAVGQRALDLALELGVREQAARLAVGVALFTAGRLDEAEHELARAQEVDTEDPVVEGRVLAYLGLIRAHRGDFGEASVVLRRAAEALEDAGDLREAGLRWQGLGNLMLWSNDLPGAEEAFSRGESCSQEYPEVLADTLRSRSKIPRRERDASAARAFLVRALEVVPPQHPVVRARVLNDLGDLEREEGRLDQAREVLEEALALREGKADGINRVNLGLLEVEAGRPRAARRVIATVFDDEQQLAWVQGFAHGVAVAAARDHRDLATHVVALEEILADVGLVEVDLLDLLGRAAREWSGREPALSARLWVLAHQQARALGDGADEVGAALIEARISGAPIPLGFLSLQLEVGRGGMGQVWRGSIEGTPIEVAVKVLSRSHAADHDTAEALGRELRAVAALDHPHIVPLVDHGEIPVALEAMTAGRMTAGTPWLAMQWADRGSLAGWTGRRSWAHVRQALLQLLDALSAAHAHGLVHLDVKPANVLVARDDDAGVHLWLSDFGIARALGRRDDAPVAGTPAYMAPEQCLRQPRRYGPWTDLYAVGGLAVALVQGVPPFSGNATELLQQQVTRQPPPLRPRIDVPAGFEAWCRRMLAKAPEDRFRCAADAAWALGELGGVAEGSRGAGADGEHGGRTSSSSTFVIDDVTVQAVALPPGTDLVAAPAPPPPHPPDTPVREPPPPELAIAASRLLPLRPVPLVGRADERARLWTELLRTAERGVRVVSLQGAPGAGRSHLLRWLGTAAAQVGAASVVELRPHGDDPIADALRSLLSAEGLDAEALEATLPRLLATHLGAHDLGDVERGLLARALVGEVEPGPLLLRVLEVLARSRPVLVAVDVDDDGRIAAMLTRLATGLSHLPVLAVCARLSSAPRLAAERCLEVTLEPVADEALHRLAGALVPLAPSLRARLVAAAHGDAGRLVWTVRGLLASRNLRLGRGGLVLRRPTDALPGSRSAAVRRLLDPVIGTTPAHRRRLELAAVLGLFVPRSTWAAACALDGVGVASELGVELAERGLWSSSGAGWQFTDDAVRTVILSTLDADERRARHRVVAAVVHGAGESARQLLAAGEPLGAMVALRQGIRRWMRTRPEVAAALVDAWSHAREAAPVADDHLEVTWGRVLGALVAEGAPQPDAATLVARAQVGGDPDLLALAWLVADQVACAEQDLDAAAAAARRALAVAGSDDVEQLARFRVGALALELNHLEEALEHLGQAVSGGEAEARSFAVSALLRMGEVEAAARWAEVARPALERGSPGVAVRQLLLAVEVAEALGHGDVVDQRLAEARRLARVVGPFYDYLATANALMVALRRGDLGARTPLLRDLVQHHGDRPFVALAAALLESDERTSAESRIERVRGCVEPVAWGVDHEEVADLLELVARASWPESGAAALRTLAVEVRQRAGRAAE